MMQTATPIPPTCDFPSRHTRSGNFLATGQSAR